MIQWSEDHKSNDMLREPFLCILAARKPNDFLKEFLIANKLEKAKVPGVLYIRSPFWCTFTHLSVSGKLGANC